MEHAGIVLGVVLEIAWPAREKFNVWMLASSCREALILSVVDLILFVLSK